MPKFVDFTTQLLAVAEGSKQEFDKQIDKLKAELQKVDKDAGNEEKEENKKDDTSFISNKKSKIEILQEACNVANQVIKLTRSADASGADKTAEMTSSEFLASHIQLVGIAEKLNDCIVKARKLYPVGMVSTTFSKNSRTTGMLEKFSHDLHAIIPELINKNISTRQSASKEDVTAELKILDEAIGEFITKAEAQLTKLRDEKKSSNEQTRNNKKSKYDLLSEAKDICVLLRPNLLADVIQIAWKGQHEVTFIAKSNGSIERLKVLQAKIEHVPSIGWLSFAYSSKSSALIKELNLAFARQLPKIEMGVREEKSVRP